MPADSCGHNNVFRLQRIMNGKLHAKHHTMFPTNTVPQEPTASAPTSIPDSLKDFLKLHPVNVSTSLLQESHFVLLIIIDRYSCVCMYTSFSLPSLQSVPLAFNLQLASNVTLRKYATIELHNFTQVRPTLLITCMNN